MKKRLWRWGLGLALMSVVLFIALLFSMDALLKSFFQNRLRKEIGLEVKIEKLHAGVLSPTLAIHNMKILNGAEFDGSPLLDVPEITLDYAPKEALSGKLHLRHLTFQLAEAHIVKNKAGKMNVDFAEDSEPASTSTAAKAKAGFEFTGIDQLNITLGKIVYSDQLEPANDQEFDLGVKNEIVTNIKSESDLADWLMTYLVKKGVNRIGEQSVGGGKVPRPKRSRREKKPAATDIVPRTAGATNN